MDKTTGRCVLFLKTNNEVARNGEGTFIRLKNSKILFAYSRFSGETWYDECTADIAAITSDDEGETWSEPQIIFKHDDNAKNLMCPSFIRLHNGDLGIIFLKKSKDSINAVPYFSRSTDEGLSFSKPQKIIDDSMNYYVIENDHAIVLKNGRIILPVNIHSRKTDGDYQIVEHGLKCIFASDDNGNTWQEITERQDIPLANISKTGLQETCVYQQNDGVLRAISRTDMAFQYECFSYDNGNTWSEPVPNTFFSSPDSPLLMKKAGKFTVAVFNPIPNYTTRDCDGTWGRTPLICAVSKDDGKTFPIIHMLENDPNNGYCYPAIFDGGNYILVSYYHSNGSGVPLTATKIKKINFDELEDWFVTFKGGIHGNGRGKNGEKITLNKTFTWDGFKWHIPAAYICPRGLVVDLCAETDYNQMQQFIKKWNEVNFNREKYTPEELDALENENPLNIDFNAKAEINGKELVQKYGSGIAWIPEELLPDGEENSKKSKKFINYYGLNEDSVWMFRRISFPWATKRKPEIKAINITLEKSPVSVCGISFKNPSAGDKIVFTHPVFGTEHTLTVKDIKQQESDNPIVVPGFIIPTHQKIMSFTLEPDINSKNFIIRDKDKNDEPKPSENTAQQNKTKTCTAIAVIGGADGPTALFTANKWEQNTHIACSALKFKPVNDVEWQIIFREKLSDDCTVNLM